MKEFMDVRTEIQNLKYEIRNLRNEMLKFQIIQTTTLVGIMIALFAIF